MLNENFLNKGLYTGPAGSYTPPAGPNTFLAGPNTNVAGPFTSPASSLSLFHTVPALSIPSSLTSRFLALVRPSQAFPIVFMPVPPFNQLSAFAALLGKEFN